LLLLNSCAWLSLKKDPEIDPSTALKSICWNGNGTGRVRFYSEKFQFRFESALDSQQKRWSLAFSGPVMGQELLEYYYSESPENVLFKGGLWQRWAKEIRKSPRGPLAMANQSIKELGPYLVWQQSANSFFKCSQVEDRGLLWKCPVHDDTQLSLEMDGENLKIVMPIKEQSVLLNYEKRKNNFYQEISISFEEQIPSNSQLPSMEIKLFFESCQQ
jgi:hypothetical protein